MKKYKVTQEFMEDLNRWMSKWERGDISVDTYSFDPKVDVVENWRFAHLSAEEQNKRFKAIVNWMNGEDIFEVV